MHVRSPRGGVRASAHGRSHFFGLLKRCPKSSGFKFGDSVSRGGVAVESCRRQIVDHSRQCLDASSVSCFPCWRADANRIRMPTTRGPSCEPPSSRPSTSLRVGGKRRWKTTCRALAMSCTLRGPRPGRPPRPPPPRSDHYSSVTRTIPSRVVLPLLSRFIRNIRKASSP